MPLSPSDGKVPDGIRYHVLDVWVDGLVVKGVEGWEGKGDALMGPVERLGREGRTRVVRERARGVLRDERLVEGGGGAEADGADDGVEGEEDGFEGCED